jgi:hypothetical protein
MKKLSLTICIIAFLCFILAVITHKLQLSMFMFVISFITFNLYLWEKNIEIEFNNNYKPLKTKLKNEKNFNSKTK